MSVEQGEPLEATEPTSRPAPAPELVEAPPATADGPAVEFAKGGTVEEALPEGGELKKEIYTPRDTIDALRLIQKKNLLEPGDGKETRNHMRNLVVTWISEKRAGTTELDWEEWYNHDTSEEDDDTGEAEEQDPTVGG